MKNIANDLHIVGHVANDQDMVSRDFVAFDPVALIDAARIEQSKEIARLLSIAGAAMANFIDKFSWNALKQARKYQKIENKLQSMSDRELLDIGLTRGMIHQAARGQVANDPQDVKVAQQVKPVETIPSAANYNKVEKQQHNAA